MRCPPAAAVGGQWISSGTERVKRRRRERGRPISSGQQANAVEAREARTGEFADLRSSAVVGGEVVVVVVRGPALGLLQTGRAAVTGKPRRKAPRSREPELKI